MNEPRTTRATSVSRCLRGCGCLVIALPLTAWLGFHGFNRLQDWRAEPIIAAELEAARAAGDAVTWQELDETASLPADIENVAPLLGDVFEALASPSFAEASEGLPYFDLEQNDSGNPRAPLPGEAFPELARAEQLLDDSTVILGLLHDAAEKGANADFEVSFSRGLIRNQDHTYQFRNALRLLSLEALVHAHRDDPDAAAKSIRTLLTLGNVLAREPDTVSQLTRLAHHRRGMQLILHLLPRCRFPEKDLLVFVELLDRLDTREALRLCVAGERVIGMMAIEMPEWWDTLNGETHTRLLAPRADLGYFLQMMARIREAIEMRWPAAIVAAKRIEADVDGIGKDPLRRHLYLGTFHMLPATSSLIRAYVSFAIQRDLFRVAIAVERFRQDHNELPRQLDDLVPTYLDSVPRDLLNGQPPNYQSTASGFQLESTSIKHKEFSHVPDEPTAQLKVEY